MVKEIKEPSYVCMHCNSIWKSWDEAAECEAECKEMRKEGKGRHLK